MKENLFSNPLPDDWMNHVVGGREEPKRKIKPAINPKIILHHQPSEGICPYCTKGPFDKVSDNEYHCMNCDRTFVVENPRI